MTTDNCEYPKNLYYYLKPYFKRYNIKFDNKVPDDFEETIKYILKNDASSLNIINLIYVKNYNDAQGAEELGLTTITKFIYLKNKVLSKLKLKSSLILLKVGLNEAIGALENNINKEVIEAIKMCNLCNITDYSLMRRLNRGNIFSIEELLKAEINIKGLGTSSKQIIKDKLALHHLEIGNTDSYTSELDILEKLLAEFGMRDKVELVINYAMANQNDIEELSKFIGQQLTDNNSNSQNIKQYLIKELNNQMFIWVAKHNNQIIATCGYNVYNLPYCENRRVCILSNMYTDKNYRKMGIQTELLKNCINKEPTIVYVGNNKIIKRIFSRVGLSNMVVQTGIH